MTSGSFFSKLKGGKKFNNLAIKRVYFGNWLRDYSQAIDVGTLSKNISPELIRIILWIMAFTEFGYGTEEFEVTSDRLGVYRAEEHIDNPKGYAEGEDARTYDKRLRGPVDPRELEIDPQTGMKNYIANERGNWPTSTKYVRESLLKCIEKGRSSRSNKDDADQYEAFRLLGQALHTLEDFSAHTNYCELVLISLGHRDVFPHVGSNCRINLNGQSVYPIVTGTFGGKDFLHSLLGGAQDSLSQVEIGEIQEQLNNGAGSQSSADALKNLFGMVPVDFTSNDEGQTYSVGGSRSVGGSSRTNFTSRSYGSIGEEIDSLQNSCAGTNANDPEELISRLYPLFEFRDRIMKKIEVFMDSVPLLSTIKEKISDALTLFIMSVIQPIIAPLINDMVTGLHSGTEMVVNDDEQFRVWNDNNYDNPTHSQLSKDHFTAYLNEPAGKIATVIIAHVVPLIVKAWEDTDINANDVIKEALQVFHHPNAASTTLQKKMRETMENWLSEVKDRDVILRGLTSQGVRTGKNLKTGNQGGQGKDSSQSAHVHQDGCGHNMGFKIPSQSDAGLSNFDNLSLGGAVAGGGAAAGAYGSHGSKTNYNSQSNKTSYNSGSSYSQNTLNSHTQSETSGYGKTSNQYSSSGSNYNQSSPGRAENKYSQHISSGRTDNQYSQHSSYGREDNQYTSSGRNDSQYNQQSSPGRSDRPSYSSSGYGGNESYGSRPSQSRPQRDDSDNYPGAGNHSYNNSRRDDDEDKYSSFGKQSYGSSRRDDDEDEYSNLGKKSYGSSRRDDDDDKKYGRQDNYSNSGYGTSTSNRYDSSNTRYGGGSSDSGQSNLHKNSSSYGQGNSRYESETYSNRNDNGSSNYGGLHDNNSSYGQSNSRYANDTGYGGGYSNQSSRYDSNSGGQDEFSSSYGNDNRFESGNSNDYSGGRHQGTRYDDNDEDQSYGRRREDRSSSHRYGESQEYGEGTGGYSRY